MVEHLPPSVLSAITAAAAVAEAANGADPFAKSPQHAMVPPNMTPPSALNNMKQYPSIMQHHHVDLNLQQHLNSQFMLSVKNMQKPVAGLNKDIHRLRPALKQNFFSGVQILNGGSTGDTFNQRMIGATHRRVDLKTSDIIVNNSLELTKATPVLEKESNSFLPPTRPTSNKINSDSWTTRAIPAKYGK